MQIGDRIIKIFMPKSLLEQFVNAAMLIPSFEKQPALKLNSKQNAAQKVKVGIQNIFYSFFEFMN